MINIVLDPIMIYGWLGCPQLGVKGAAYATIIGQIASALVGLILHLKVNREIKNSFSYMKPSGRIIKGIYSIGFAAFGLRDAITPIVSFNHGMGSRKRVQDFQNQWLNKVVKMTKCTNE